MEYSLRNLTEFSYLVLKRQCSTEYFSYRFELSKYELKMDLVHLEQMAPLYGTTIEKNADTIYLKISDEIKFEKIVRGFLAFYYINRYNFNDDDVLIQLLLASKLLNEGYLIVEDCAEELGYSKSALRVPLKMARGMIEGYNLKTFVKPYMGLCFEGNELDIRRCLASIYIKLVPEIFATENEVDYFALNIDYTKTYNTFVQLCGENHFVFSAEENKMICYYLTIMKSRVNNYHTISSVEVEPQIIHAIKHNKKLLDLVLKIAQKLDILINESEKTALLLILFINGADKPALMDFVNSHYQKEKIELREIIFSTLFTKFKLVITDEYVCHIIENIISSILIRKHAGDLDKLDIRVSGMSSNIYGYPLCYYIYKVLKETIDDFYQINCSPAIIEVLTDAVYYYIDSLDYDVKKYRIAISCRNNPFGAEFYKNKILTEIDSRYIEMVDVISSITMRSKEKDYSKQYDVIISDAHLLSSPSHLTISSINNSALGLEKQLRARRDLCSSLGKYGLRVINKEISAANGENLTDTLGREFMISKDDVSTGMKYHYIWKNTLFVIIDIHGEESCLAFGNFENVFELDGRKIEDYVLYKGVLNENTIKLVNLLLHEMALEHQFLLKLKEHPEPQTINDHLNSILK